MSTQANGAWSAKSSSLRAVGFRRTRRRCCSVSKTRSFGRRLIAAVIEIRSWLCFISRVGLPFSREKRAHVYALPLDTIDRRNGGRPPADDAGVSEGGDATGPSERSETPGDAQQRLDTVADGKDQENARAVDATDQPTDESDAEREQRANQASREQPRFRTTFSRRLRRWRRWMKLSKFT